MFEMRDIHTALQSQADRLLDVSNNVTSNRVAGNYSSENYAQEWSLVR
jgi:hypothetical protein